MQESVLVDDLLGSFGVTPAKVFVNSSGKEFILLKHNGNLASQSGKVIFLNVSSADGYAWDVVRVIPPAILTGQAAAVIASRAIRENRSVCDADISLIRADLEKRDVIVRFDDALVPPDAATVNKHREKL